MKTKRMVSFLLMISMLSVFLVLPANASEDGNSRKINMQPSTLSDIGQPKRNHASLNSEDDYVEKVGNTSQISKLTFTWLGSDIPMIYTLPMKQNLFIYELENDTTIIPIEIKDFAYVDSDTIPSYTYSFGGIQVYQLFLDNHTYTDLSYESNVLTEPSWIWDSEYTDLSGIQYSSPANYTVGGKTEIALDTDCYPSSFSSTISGTVNS
ncbi:MAG: hypothetical protein LKJ17_10775 [Oscillospiraceae bacterium]|nr:hypothetical protein [Oscillospiraceae bacterium]